MVTKKEFVSLMVENHGTTKADATSAYDMVFQTLTTLLSEGEEVNTPIGRFKHRTLAPRIARNPKTGEQINLPERKSLHLTIAKNIKDAFKQLQRQ